MQQSQGQLSFSYKSDYHVPSERKYSNQKEHCILV